MTFPDGTSAELPVLHVRATELTVGPEGPRSMPASLPPSSAYTYAVELSVDEALEAGASRVTFDAPVALYVDNFLGFPVGQRVPVGYYDVERGVWVASDSGRVIEIVGIFAGLAALDTDGDGDSDAADEATLGELGVLPGERAQLAATYPVGQSLWRVTVDHFTPYDLNWSAFVPASQRPVAKPRRIGINDDDPCRKAGSIVSCQTRTLGEEVGLPGTGLSLIYSSDRARNRQADRHLRIELTGPSVSPDLLGIRLTIDVAGQHHELVYPPDANQTEDFI